MAEVLCPIAQRAKEDPRGLALVTALEMLSYEHLDNAVSHLVCQLKDKGIREDTKVAFVATTSLAAVLLLFALFRLKAIACPLSFRTPAAGLPSLLKQIGDPHFVDLAACVIDFSKITSSEELLDTEQLATFLFTSGSSGAPKIACHTLGNHYFSALGATSALNFTSKSRWRLALPLFHVGGIAILFRSFIAGGAVVLQEKFPVTHVSFVPTQLLRLLQEPAAIRQAFAASLQCILLGGAPVSDALFRMAQGMPLFVTYGMTEMSSMITLATPDTLRTSCHGGTPLPFRKMQIAADGEIWVSGATLFAGYWDGKAVQRCEGWFATRDLGRWTNDGNLVVTGRKDRLFISGGENIQPEEIERALCALPGVLGAYVAPQEDPTFGARPVAYILEEKPEHTLMSIKEALASVLPAFKHPVEVFPFTQEMRDGFKPRAS